LFKYFGGKSRVARKIVRHIPEHKTWVEAFAGGASVTLAKPPSKKEVLADKRADVTRFFRRVKSGEPIEDLKPDLSKREFEIIRGKPENRRSPAEFLAFQQKKLRGSW
jgi:site-specific DNA-adenine methylase